MKKGDIIFIEAEVIGQQDGVLTVKILNGFGNPQEQVHRHRAIFPASGGVITRDKSGGGSYCGSGS